MSEPLIPVHLRELNSEQAALLEKLKANYNTDCPALLHYIAKIRPDIIADREKGLVNPVKFVVLMGKSDRPKEQAEKSQPMQFLRGEMSAWRDNGLLKSAAEFAAKLVHPQESDRNRWSELFRKPWEREKSLLSPADRALIPGWDNLPGDAGRKRQFVEFSFVYCKSTAIISFISDVVLKDQKSFSPARVSTALYAAFRAKLNDLSPKQMEKLEIPEGVERLSVQDFKFLLDDSKIAFEKNGLPKPLAYGVAILFGFHETAPSSLSPGHLRKAIFAAFEHEVPAAVVAVATAVKRDCLELPERPKPTRDNLPVLSRAVWGSSPLWKHIV